MFGSPSVSSPHAVESGYGMDSRIWSNPLLWWGDCSKYLPGRYAWICVTSTRDYHLGHASFGGRYTPGASHNPTVLASHRGWKAKVCDGCERYSATGSSDAYTHPSAASIPPRVDRQSRISNRCSHRVKPQDWESPSTPRPPSLLPLKVRTLMYMGDWLPKAEMMAVSLPATPEEEERGPSSGRPICRCLTRRVGAQLGCLVIPLHPPPKALRGLLLTLWRAFPTLGAQGGRRT